MYQVFLTDRYIADGDGEGHRDGFGLAVCLETPLRIIWSSEKYWDTKEDITRVWYPVGWQHREEK